MAELGGFSRQRRMEDIPQELLYIMFLKLPIKSVARSRCVCKQWNTLISSPGFIAQRNASGISDSEEDCLLVVSKQMGGNSRVYDLFIPPFNSEGCRKRVEAPVKRCYEKMFVGAVKGVVCISGLMQQRIPPAIPTIVLWNPLTGTTKSTLIMEGFSIEGFGYDPTTMQFKVIAAYNNDESPVQYQVCSHGDLKWRKLPVECNDLGTSIDEWYLHMHVYYRVSIHWMRYDHVIQEWFILGFDCSKEDFHRLYLPEELANIEPPIGYWPQHYYRDWKPETLLVDECLGDLAIYHFDHRFMGLDLQTWLMQEYGNRKSWVKYFRVPIHDNLIDLRFSMENSKVWMWRLGEVVLKGFEAATRGARGGIEDQTIIIGGDQRSLEVPPCQTITSSRIFHGSFMLSDE